MSEENGRTDLTWRELLDEGGARLSEAGVPDAGRPSAPHCGNCQFCQI